ncbi:MAG: penicillin-binding transpeptidase domain-containing protein [Lachnospiraceae bacterium]|nr:penicillin-binding transpeptidase domain-containing protein [Lachnospiraceae bacterium]
MKKTRMKFCGMIMILILVSISGCASKEQSSERESGEITETPVKTEISDESPTPVEEQSPNEGDIQVADSDIIKNDIDLSAAFHGINGCAVLYSSKDNMYSLYNANMCEQEVSPYSTFKVISTLAGLKNGIVEDASSKMNYTGEQYAIPEWNADLGLREAFQTSCIWYFRQVIDAVGEDEIQKELTDLSYGNCDVSEWNGSNANPIEELNGFWLDSTLKISPFEQVQVLAKIFEGDSIYNEKNVNILKEIMLIQDDGTQKIYGKTGSGSEGQAWFVGFSEKNDETKYFAIYLDDNIQKENISGSTAKEIALKIME